MSGVALGESKEAAATAVESASEAVDSVESAAEVVEDATEVIGEMGKDLAGEHATEAGELGHAAMSEADLAEAMAKFMELTTPNEHHAKLDAFVGSWDITMRTWMAPGAPPQESVGTTEITWVLDGRYLQENFQGTAHMPGSEPQPYLGFGFRGYDNAKQQYSGFWADNMSTVAMPFVGHFDDETQTLHSTSSFDCPMQGQTSMRMTTTVVGPNELLLTAYTTVEGQEEIKAMEIVYKRRY